MATFTERVQILFDLVGADKAASQLGKFKSEVSAAEGFGGKLKATGQGVFDFATKTAGGMTALATGAVAFASKAIGEFQSLALEADKTAAAMGTGVEDASRWIEVSGDLGVSTDAIATAAGRLNKEVSKGTLEKYGIDAENANDRLIETLAYIGGITNSAEQARVGAELLGKGWQSLSPIFAEFRGDAEGLRKALADVSDAKVITDEEVAKAKRFRDAMDELKGVVEDFTINVGGQLVPMLSDFADVLTRTENALGAVTDMIPGVGDGFAKMVNPLAKLGDGLATATDSSNSFTERLRGLGQATVGQVPGLGWLASGLLDVKDKTDKAADAQRQFGPTADEVTAAFKKVADQEKETAEASELLAETSLAVADAMNEQVDAAFKLGDATLALSNAQNDWQQTLQALPEDLKSADGDLLKMQDTLNKGVSSANDMAEANVRVGEEAAKAAGRTTTAASKMDAYNTSMVKAASQASGPLRTAILDYIATVNGIPTDVVTDIQAAIDRGDIAEAERLLNSASRTRTAAVNADANTAAAEAELNNTARTRTAKINVVANVERALASSGMFFGGGGYGKSAPWPGETATTGVGARGTTTTATVPVAANSGPQRAVSGPARTTVNIYNPVGTNPEKTYGMIRRYERRNGSRV